MNLLIKPLLVMLLAFVSLFLFMPSQAYGKESVSDKIGKVSKAAEDVGKVAKAAGEVAAVAEAVAEKEEPVAKDGSKGEAKVTITAEAPFEIPPKASIGVLIALFVVGGCSALANFFEADKKKGMVSTILKLVNVLALNFSKKAGR